ncbi:IS66 family insertion sequence element accessory protein TnpB [Sphingobacterium litopenaei]|uniref:IS66 family insertion sequence element accessory protein TnpB n=1 Tax=Sphingobacterium litopenaei TaxID=2763500 RepID=A0ABR7YD07_9SPHI|nr:IS66 family insertion sequence element accessory protein TnpB [Sphingobacterium litopenaei]
MFSLGSSHKFFLYDGFCDMRKSFEGLCGLVISVMQRQPTSGEVFVFLNRTRTHIKLLHWEPGGFVLGGMLCQLIYTMEIYKLIIIFAKMN